MASQVVRDVAKEEVAPMNLDNDAANAEKLPVPNGGLSHGSRSPPASYSSSTHGLHSILPASVCRFIAGPAYYRGYLRLLFVTGSFMIVFGVVMLSLCAEYWQPLLAQAFCVGISAGLLFVPTVSLLPTCFSTHLGLAVGIASSCSSLGSVIYPIVLYPPIGQICFP
ncbi:hypothetical protein DL764_008920 [Monosporascus ibericus]|uniref:Major facilitator superfamily (MFS) profile domain-containing protein n=1 Tax=Monosporascus ibericus TaxID=155417 RepID=A0A4Q4SWC8_9PEZI|nr:hypothetical protein DL764_008920 [Monosporascus ibericus]